MERERKEGEGGEKLIPSTHVSASVFSPHARHTAPGEQELQPNYLESTRHNLCENIVFLSSSCPGIKTAPGFKKMVPQGWVEAPIHPCVGAQEALLEWP